MLIFTIDHVTSQFDINVHVQENISCTFDMALIWPVIYEKIYILVQYFYNLSFFQQGKN